MKKIFKWLSVIFAVSLCWGLMLFPCLIGSAETALPNAGYVYYAKGEDGVLTAYSKVALSENVSDVTVQQTTKTLVVDTEYAFEVEFKNGASGKIYVELKMDGSSENLRVVKIDGKKISNLDARFTAESITFHLDQAGTYAVIDVTVSVNGGFAWYHALIIAGFAASVALCVVAVVRRKK